MSTADALAAWLAFAAVAASFSWLAALVTVSTAACALAVVDYATVSAISLLAACLAEDTPLLILSVSQFSLRNDIISLASASLRLFFFADFFTRFYTVLLMFFSSVDYCKNCLTCLSANMQKYYAVNGSIYLSVNVSMFHFFLCLFT